METCPWPSLSLQAHSCFSCCIHTPRLLPLIHSLRRRRHTLSRAQPSLESHTANSKLGDGRTSEEIKKPWVHFIGIGGSGLSALALFALKEGWQVSGSDVSCGQKVEDLRNAGATVHIGHQGSQLRAQDGRLPDHVVFSSAIPCTNEELSMARTLKIPSHKRGPWLARLTSSHDLIAVSGSHGKSTTTAMISVALKEMGNDISALVGANVFQFPEGGGVLYGTGSQFVLEADEYDGCFLSLSPHLAVITNIEWEHVDMFPNENAVIDCFRKFVMRIKAGGTVIYSGDNAATRSLVKSVLEEKATNEDGFNSINFISYGVGSRNMWQAVMLEPNTMGGTNYIAVYNGEVMTKVELKIPGVHNVLNSLAAIVTVAALSTESVESSLEIQKEAANAASKSLQGFYGIERRFELLGMGRGFQIYDDYAHHPTEILAVMEAARKSFYNKPIWLVFQPHTYSRLASLLADFAVALSAADHVIVTQVFSARENDCWGVTGEDLVNRIQGPPAVYLPKMDTIPTYIMSEVALFQANGQEDEIVIFTLGAGDIRNVGLRLLEAFK